MRLHRFVQVYTCQNATLLKITRHGSNVKKFVQSVWIMVRMRPNLRWIFAKLKQVNTQLAFKSGPQSPCYRNAIKMAFCCWDDSGYMPYMAIKFHHRRFSRFLIPYLYDCFCLYPHSSKYRQQPQTGQV